MRNEFHFSLVKALISLMATMPSCKPDAASALASCTFWDARLVGRERKTGKHTYAGIKSNARNTVEPYSMETRTNIHISGNNVCIGSHETSWRILYNSI